MTATAKTMETRPVRSCRIHLVSSSVGPPHSRLLSGLGGQSGRFNAELLCVLGFQSLPAAELHGLRADHAADAEFR